MRKNINSEIYKGWDTHAYSPLLKSLIGQLNISNSPTSNEEYEQTMVKLRDKYGAQIDPCLQNIRNSYFRNNRIIDPDLGNYNIFHVLVELYNWLDGKQNIKRILSDIDPVLTNDNILNSIIELSDINSPNDVLKDSLVEVGNTCIQGLTHRLLLLYICKKQQ